MAQKYGAAQDFKNLSRHIAKPAHQWYPGESDELDHLYPEQIDQGIRSKLTTHFRTKLTTLIRAN